jgi:GntR family transcriptional regulator
MDDNLNLVLVIHPQSGIPIYRQVIDQVRSLIVSGRLKPGELVPSVRLLAQQLAVNPMTISKAYTRLELEGWLEHDRGVGMRVGATGIQPSVKERKEQLRPLIEQLLLQANQLNLTRDQIMQLIDQLIKEQGSST